MQDHSPIVEGIDQEFGDLLSMLDEASSSGAIMVWITAAMGATIVTLVAGIVVSQNLF